MGKNFRKALIILVLLIIILGSFIAYDFIRFYDGKLHITFCDVGQGDAVFIRTPSGKNILVDGGPDKSVLYCLSRHMPFWERTLNLVFLTHPHEDHLTGIYYVIDRYDTLRFVTVNLSNNSQFYKDFSHKINEKKILTGFVYSGDSFNIPGSVVLEILSPTREFLLKSSPGGVINSSKEQASIVVHVKYGSFDLLLTGDSQASNLEQLVNGNWKPEIGKSEVLQIPHHGSKTSLNEDLINLINPQAAVISVGKNNYGHPNKGIIELLTQKGIKILRTDQKGDIDIFTNGKEWEIRQ